MKKLTFIVFLLLYGFSMYSQEGGGPSKPPAANHALILFDAFSKDTSLAKGWGFSSLIQYNGKRILFDAGSNADVFKANVLRLGVDLKTIDFVVVSHAQYDHLNGIDYLLSINPSVKIYFPYDTFWGAPSLFNATGLDSLVKDSLPPELRYFDGASTLITIKQAGGRFLHANIEFVKEYKEILPGIVLVPTQAKYMGYFSKYPKSPATGKGTDSNEEVKLTNLPELSLSLATDKGEVLFVGCSHTGVENIIRESMLKTQRKVDLLVGGFHLLPFDRQQTIRICDLIQNDLQVTRVAPGHCTGHLGFKLLRNRYNEHFLYAGLGEQIVF